MKRQSKKFPYRSFNIPRSMMAIIWVAMILLVVLWFVYFTQTVQEFQGTSRAVALNECVPFGYLLTENSFINTVGDAHIQLPGINQYVSDISLKFAAPIEQPLNIRVYYAESDHGYSEEYTAWTNINEGAGFASLFIGRNITTCRIDIGSLEGEKFVLERIVINGNQLKFYKEFILFFATACFVTAILAVFVCKLDLEKIFSMLALFFGILYLFTITPLSAPDEATHYYSSYKLSNLLLFQWNSIEYGDSADFNFSDFSIHKNVSSGYIRILEEIGDPAAQGEKIRFPGSSRSVGYFIDYLPQALGITFARLTNQNFVRTFLLGRLFNLLFYSACLYLAVKRTPVFKTMFGLIGMMPMSLHQAASYSYDGFINGMSLILIASILKAIYEDGLLSRKDYCYILISGALLAPAKVVYYAIIMLAILIPKQRFGGRKEKIIGISIIWAVGLLFIIGFQLPSILSMTSTASRGLNYEGYHNYTVSFIFEHPCRTIEIFARTLVFSTWGWLRCATGQVMSGLTLEIPSWIVNCYMLVLVLSVLNHEKSEYVLRVHTRRCFLLVCMIVVLLTMMSMFLTWTSDFRTVITGVQGRYFIPIVSLIMLSLNNQVFVLRKNIDKALMLSAVVLHGSTIYSILDYTFQH